MQKLFPVFLLALGSFALNAEAQNNSALNGPLMISTTSNGDVMWNASIDGTSRRGYVYANTNTNPESLFEGVCMHNGSVSKYADVQEVVPTKVVLYPNQSTDVLFFSGRTGDSFALTILDSDGKITTSYTYTDDHSLDISSFENGTYLIELVSEKTGKKYTRKIVK